MADALSLIGPICLEKEVDKILKRARNSQAPRTECDDPWMVEYAEAVKEDVVIPVRAITNDELRIHRLQ